jgi:GNAT superfamily N-acetyltransferase/chorismate mutase
MARARLATVDDADVLAQLLHDFNVEFDTPAPAVPKIAANLRALLAGDATFAFLAGAPPVGVGLVTLRPNVWYDGPVALLDELYVVPDRRGEGIGTAMVEVFLAECRARGVQLVEINVDESDVDAQRFYRRHGFVEVRRTDGSDNEEREPDVEMAWPDPGSMEGMRRRVDAVDDRLAGLLAERARLTARIQRVKAVPGHAGRDRVREAEIVERMARRAPELGAERLARIMDAVITESLDAAEQAAGHAAGQSADQSAEQAAGRESQHPAPSG